MTLEEKMKKQKDDILRNASTASLVEKLVGDAPEKLDMLFGGIVIGSLAVTVLNNGDKESMYRFKFQVQEILKRLNKGRNDLEKVIDDVDKKINEWGDK